MNSMHTQRHILSAMQHAENLSLAAYKEMNEKQHATCWGTAILADVLVIHQNARSQNNVLSVKQIPPWFHETIKCAVPGCWQQAGRRPQLYMLDANYSI
jgi:hypothetical protein